MKRNLFIVGAAVLFVFVLAGCSLFGPDTIVGSWQQASVNGIPTVLVTVIDFTAKTYTGSIAGVTSNAGTWTKSGDSYTLTGSFFGLIGTTSTITPSFTNSDNRMTYVDKDGFNEIYNRQ